MADAINERLAAFRAALGRLEDKRRELREDAFRDGGELAAYVALCGEMHSVNYPRIHGGDGRTLEVISKSLDRSNYGIKMWGAVLDVTGTWNAWTGAPRSAAKQEAHLSALTRLTSQVAAFKEKAAGGGACPETAGLIALFGDASRIGWPRVHDAAGRTLAEYGEMSPPGSGDPGFFALIAETTRAWGAWEQAV